MTYALLDINAFYVSAQVLFEPWLKNRAIVVLSNNDGAVVSRNDQAKALGVKMSQPAFELRSLIDSGQLIVYSSNYQLYQSLSNRFMAIIDELAPSKFQYSIDECFCLISGIEYPEAWARNAQAEIMRRIGLPIGVGIGPTPTLCKLANWAAKKFKAKTGCVVDLSDPERQRKLMQYAKVEEVWGIGSRLSRRLSTELGIETAWQLAMADPKHLRRHFSVSVERTSRELRGTPCVNIEEAGAKQMIISSRSFGTRITTIEGLQQAVAGFVATAAQKLRAQGSFANCLQVFARTSPFSTDPQYSATRIVSLPYPTHDTRDLHQAAMHGLNDLYREGPMYAKAGIVLSQFEQRGEMTGDMFAPAPRENSDALMAVVDAINAKQGRGTIRLGRDSGSGQWQMRRAFLTPAYTTSWHGLPRARC